MCRQAATPSSAPPSSAVAAAIPPRPEGPVRNADPAGFNAVANHTFQEGRLKGLGVGTPYRGEDKRSIGYRRKFDDFGFVITEVNSPVFAPSNDNGDTWVSDRRKLWQKYDWRLQLHFSNVPGEIELVPIRANPDGTFGPDRISSWRLSSSISF